MRPSSTRRIAIAWAILAATAIPQLHAGSSLDEGPARLEFRILATMTHDRAAAEKARAAAGVNHPPDGYRWVLLGSVVESSDAKVESKRIAVPGARWKENEFAGATVQVKGKNLAGSDLSKEFAVAGNTAEALQLRPDPALFFKSISFYRIDLTPSRLGGEFAERDLIIRVVPEGPGRVKKFILVQLDRHDVSEKDLTRVFPDVDERLNPAVRFEFSRAGARKFGALTREHLPEANDSFKYQLGIILDGLLMSAPVINSEIRDAGIIELGKDARPEEVDHIIKILRLTRKGSK